MSILAAAEICSAPGSSLAAGFFILNEAGTDVVGFYNTVFMQRGKAGGKRGRKNFCAGRQMGGGMAEPKEENVLPLKKAKRQAVCLECEAFQTEIALKGHCLEGMTFAARRRSAAGRARHGELRKFANNFK